MNNPEPIKVSGNSLRQGDIVSVDRGGFKSWLVRKALGSLYPHDAIAYREDREWFTGNSRLLGSLLGSQRIRIAKLIELEKKGKARLRIGRPTQYVHQDLHSSVEGAVKGAMAADYWNTHIAGTRYDWSVVLMATALLSVRPFIRERNWRQTKERIRNKLIDIPWNYWCTEGINDSWSKGGETDLYATEHPMPEDTDRLFEDGTLTLLHETEPGRTAAKKQLFRRGLRGPRVADSSTHPTSSPGRA